MKKWKSSVKVLLLLLFLIGICSGCGSAAGKGDRASSAVPAGSLRSTKEGKTAPGPEQSCGLVQQYSIFELSEESTLVVYGRVSCIHEPVLVKRADGGVIPYTDVELETKETFRREAEEKVLLRLLGGMKDGEYVEAFDTPELLLGQSYLFFLFHSSKGLGVYAKDQYCLTTGTSQGLFVPVPQAASDPTSKGLVFQSCKAPEEIEQEPKASLGDTLARNAVFSAEELKELYTEFNEIHPVDESRFYREALEAYQANLESGFFSQKEYDRLLSLLDTYAEEITLEEAKKWEAENEAKKEELRKRLEEEAP